MVKMFDARAALVDRLSKKYRLNVVIWAPPYNPCSGGCMMLHKLCDLMRKRGVNAYLSPCAAVTPADKLCDSFDTPVYRGVIKDDFVVIYPEVVTDNPLKGKKIVRWLLNNPKVFNPQFVPGKNDMIIAFSDHFAVDYPGCDKLFFSEWREDIFNNNNTSVRSGVCYTVRKFKGDRRIPQTDDGLEITGQNGAELAEIFRTKEVFYSYDNATFLSLQAALCGCVSVVIPSDDMSKEEWRCKMPCFKYGVAYGIEDIEYAKETMSLVQSYLASLNEEGMMQLDRLIEKLCAY